MFSGFQASAYQNSAFQIVLSVVVPPVVSKGGINPQDVKRYLDFIERLKRLDNKKELTPKIIEAAKSIEPLPIATAQIEAIANAEDYTPQIDFDALAIELAEIRAYLDLMQYNYFIAEQDDEIAFLLLIN